MFKIMYDRKIGSFSYPNRQCCGEKWGARNNTWRYGRLSWAQAPKDPIPVAAAFPQADFRKEIYKPGVK